MLDVVIADDEALALSRLDRCLREIGGVRIAGRLTNGDEFAEFLPRHEVDGYFLDIRMPGASVFNTLSRLAPDARPTVVFVTAHDDYAVKAFDLEAVDYLLKPVETARLADTLRRMQRKDVRPIPSAALDGLLGSPGPEPIERLLAESAGVERVIPVAGVETFEAARNYVRLHLARGERALIRRPLTRLERELDPRRFVRIHRSLIVNLDWVRQVEPWFSGDAILVMASGAKQRMSRRFRERFYRLFAPSR